MYIRRLPSSWTWRLECSHFVGRCSIFTPAHGEYIAVRCEPAASMVISSTEFLQWSQCVVVYCGGRFDWDSAVDARPWWIGQPKPDGDGGCSVDNARVFRWMTCILINGMILSCTLSLTLTEYKEGIHLEMEGLATANIYISVNVFSIKHLSIEDIRIVIDWKRIFHFLPIP